MAKKGEYGGCHFNLFEFSVGKWQKTAKRKLNSRGILFLAGAVVNNIIGTVDLLLEGGHGYLVMQMRKFSR